MKDKNSPLWLTERYLKDFRGQKRYIALLESEIQDRYETATNMIAIYGEHVGRSTAERLHIGAILAVDEEFQMKKSELEKAKREMKAIEGGLSDLAHAERVIIQRRYLDAKPSSWVAISQEVGYSERSCHYLQEKALRHLTISLYGKDTLMSYKTKNAS